MLEAREAPLRRRRPTRRFDVVSRDDLAVALEGEADHMRG
jgi:hypothetical protein